MEKIMISQPITLVKYLANFFNNITLTGTTSMDNIHVDQWLEYVTTDLAPLCEGWSNGTNKIPFTKAPAIKLLDTHFKSQTYLVGNTITIADIAVACTLLDAVIKVFDTKARDELVYLYRWLQTMYDQPHFSSIISEVIYPTEVVMPKKEAPAKSPAPAKQQQQQQQQKEKQGEASKPEPKPVNPLSLLPPTSMSLDDVKHDFFRSRPYNKEYFPEEFWKQFDPSGYTLYLTEYQYPEDLDKDSYTNNLATGFFSRCEVTSKYAFAVANIVKLKDKQYQILGAFIVRGPGINKEQEEVSDFEEYKFEKLDPQNSEHRQRFNERMISSDKIDGYEQIDKQYLK